MSLPWLKLYRQIDRNVLYFSEPFDKAHAWIDLLILANDSDGEKLVGLSKVDVKRGDVLQSYDDLARRWKWSKTSVARFIEFLVSENMVSKKRNGRNVTLSIVKYEFFQGERKDDGTITERLRNNRGTIVERSDGVGDIYINKYSNRERREKKEKENKSPSILTDTTPSGGHVTQKKQFVKPSLEEVEDFCYEQNLSIDPEQFIDFYETNGWMVGRNHMKDWKAAARNWDRRRKTEDKGSRFMTKGEQAAKDMDDSYKMYAEWAKGDTGFDQG